MIKFLKNSFVVVSLMASIAGGQMILPALANAQTKAPAATPANDPCVKLKNQITNGGFNIKDNNVPTYCSTGALYNKVIRFALFAVGIVSVIVIIYGGYLYMTAGAKEDQRKRGRSVLTWAIIGLAIVILASLLVNVVISAITGA